MRSIYLAMFMIALTASAHAGKTKTLGCTGIKNRQLPWSEPPTLEQIEWAKKDKLPANDKWGYPKECKHILDEIEGAVKAKRKDIDWQWTTSTMIYWCCH